MWKLKCSTGGSTGRHVWEFDRSADPEIVKRVNAAREEFIKERKSYGRQNSADMIFRTWKVWEHEQRRRAAAERGDESAAEITADASSVRQSLRAGIAHFQKLQDEDGHWPGDYGGPMFLLPGLVIMSYITGVQFSEEHKREMIRYLSFHQHTDGGWGLHIEGDSTIFGSALQYCALRLLGLRSDDEIAIRGRAFMHQHGGAVGIPSWGKFWLAVLGVYDWEGLNPISPEMWLAPYWFPFQPGRMWCHCRVVYLPMAYCYGHRVTATLTPLLRELRTELYTTPYETIDWPAQRNRVCPIDVYSPHRPALDVVHRVLGLYERFHSKALRRRALDKCIAHIHHEDETTRYIDIGPVNKVINMLCVWHACGPDSPQFQRHRERLADYLWVAEDGMKMQGYNGSQLWDTAFAVQAILAGPADIVHEFRGALDGAARYLETTQVMEDVDDREPYYRHLSKGAWPFSTRDHGWPISDCTSEGLKSVLELNRLPFIATENKIGPWRLYDAVNVSLSLQNRDGGWATYEQTRTTPLIEHLNPSEVFGDIMIDYSYVECTSASVQALHKFQQEYPEHRTVEVKRAIENGIECVRNMQREDGSWYGSWGVCFTYAIFFGIQALSHVCGESYSSSDRVRRASDFLVSKQAQDGGWGESYLSCVTKQYVQNERRSQIVNTAWALLGLLDANYPNREVIDRGIKFLLSRQHKDGEFPQEEISGVFNRNCMITYINYRNIFPIWAMSVYLKKFGDKKF